MSCRRHIENNRSLSKSNHFADVVMIVEVEVEVIAVASKAHCDFSGISEKVKTAFARSDSVVFELDLYNSNTIERLSECKNIPGGGTVKDYLSPKLYLRLEHYMRIYRNRLERQYDRKENLPASSETKNRPRHIFGNIVEGWERRRPVWLLFLLYQLSEKYLYREHTPMLDLFLAQYALELNKNFIRLKLLLRLES
ncbi:Metalloprotease TIKI-like protein [Dirofilaria immitis]|nr:Metalloprotease TIKI-like protein [Dirofilaria immitis]